MKHYIALGGIGCRTLKAFAENNKAASERCYYIDTDPAIKYTVGDAERLYIVKGLETGSACLRGIGKNAVRHDILNGRFAGFFGDIVSDGDAEIVIITSACGGFGSAAAGEFSEYLQALMWEKHGRKKTAACSIVAFSGGMFRSMGFPKMLLDKLDMNTFETVRELADGGKAIPENAFARGVFNPNHRFYLVNTAGMTPAELSAVPGMDDLQLSALDIQKEYIEQIKPASASSDVFISYSSVDQKIADMLNGEIKKRGIGTWIATENIREGSYAAQIMRGIRQAKVFVVLISKNSIASEQVKNEIDRAFTRLKDGIKIIPYIIDDAELDDECAYYLCRQEFFFAKQPPMDARISELADIIADMLR